MNTGSRLAIQRVDQRITPPPIEKNQNATGITLLRARSVAIHCTTKRMVKNPCATKPRTTQPVELDDEDVVQIVAEAVRTESVMTSPRSQQVSASCGGSATTRRRDP